MKQKQNKTRDLVVAEHIKFQLFPLNNPLNFTLLVCLAGLAAFSFGLLWMQVVGGLSTPQKTYALYSYVATSNQPYFIPDQTPTFSSSSATSLITTTESSSLSELLSESSAAQASQSNSSSSKSSVATMSVATSTVSSSPTVQSASSQKSSVLISCAGDAWGTSFLGLLNAYRASLQKPAVSLEPAMTNVACAHTRYMINLGDLTHQRADGKEFWQQCAEYGTSCDGENVVFASPSLSPEKALELWKNSPPHNENMLGDHTVIGVWQEGGYSTLEMR